MTTSVLAYWLAACHLTITPRKFLHWLQSFKNIQSLFHASHEELLFLGIKEKYIQKIKNPDWKIIEKEMLWAQESNHHILTLEDEKYPQLLKETVDPPLILFAKGNVSALKTKQIAIVGSRSATPTGLKNAEQFASHLAEAGLTITSGLALGIDGAAHRGALKVKGVTVAVFGTGFNFLYPSSHRPLAKEIINQDGVLISEFSLATPPQPKNFPQRNRIISGLSLGVLVVEAAMESGSLITARLALEEGREVFAIPGSIHNPVVRGCHYLLKQGAKLVETVDDIFEELNIPQTIHEKVERISKKALKPAFKVFLSHIDYEITAFDVILLRSGLTMSEVSSILLTLELEGYIQSVAGGYIKYNQTKIKGGS